MIDENSKHIEHDVELGVERIVGKDKGYELIYYDKNNRNVITSIEKYNKSGELIEKSRYYINDPNIVCEKMHFIKNEIPLKEITYSNGLSAEIYYKDVEKVFDKEEVIYGFPILEEYYNDDEKN